MGKYTLMLTTPHFKPLLGVFMSSKHESTRLENSTYNILMALGKEADFLYSTADTYIEDARAGRYMARNEKR
jgi:hypothetical protein